MKDPSKHYVIVETGQVEDYLLRGFARSAENIRDHLPPLFKDPDALGLVLMETGKAAFEAAQAPPVRYEVNLESSSYIRRAFVAKLDVLSKDPETPGWSFVGKGDAATRVRDVDMFETPREAVADSAIDIRAAIAEHRAAADELEAYLKAHDL